MLKTNHPARQSNYFSLALTGHTGLPHWSDRWTRSPSTLDTSETKLCSSKEHKPPKQSSKSTKSSLCTHIDRGGVTDLSVSGDNFDLVGGDPHDPTTMSKTQSANAIAEPTPNGYRPCWRKISLITKINSCVQSKNEQESEARNLNITRRWRSESQRISRICACSGVAKARCKTKLEL
jgi:hypothetical protein